MGNQASSAAPEDPQPSSGPSARADAPTAPRPDRADDSFIQIPEGLYKGDANTFPHPETGKLVTQRTGSGILVYHANDSFGRAKYVGEFRENLRHGNGTLIWKDGRSYKGEWRQDRMHGSGRFEWPSGMIYQGEFLSNQFHGVGTLRWPEGKIYSGEWRAGKFHGRGRLQYPPNDRKGRVVYEGRFEEGVRCGTGVMRWSHTTTQNNNNSNTSNSNSNQQNSSNSNVPSYSMLATQSPVPGYFPPSRTSNLTLLNANMSNMSLSNSTAQQQQQANQNMTVMNSNESCYEGEWKANKRHGKGVFYFPPLPGQEYVSYSGEWLKGQRSGKGILISVSGEQYSGEFSDDKRHGTGVRVLAHGRVIYETYVKGIRQPFEPFRQQPQTLATLCIERLVAQSVLGAQQKLQLPQELRSRVLACEVWMTSILRRDVAVQALQLWFGLPSLEVTTTTNALNLYQNLLKQPAMTTASLPNLTSTIPLANPSSNTPTTAIPLNSSSSSSSAASSSFTEAQRNLVAGIQAAQYQMQQRPPFVTTTTVAKRYAEDANIEESPLDEDDEADDHHTTTTASTTSTATSTSTSTAHVPYYPIAAFLKASAKPQEILSAPSTTSTRRSPSPMQH